MTVNGTIATIVAILGLGAALQNFFLVPLLGKLVGIAVGALVAVKASSSALRKWAYPRPGPGFLQRPSSPSKLIAVVAIQAVLCFLFAGLAYTVVRYNGIRVDVPAAAGHKVTFWFHGALQGADTLTIHVPAADRTRCGPVDAYGGGRYRADVQIIDWNTSNPRLQLSNFFYPQLVGVQCGPPVELDQLAVRVEPTSIELFFPDRTFVYNVAIFVAGGLLWLFTLWPRFSSPS